MKQRWSDEMEAKKLENQEQLLQNQKQQETAALSCKWKSSGKRNGQLEGKQADRQEIRDRVLQQE